jgi:hypothetical protein
MFVLQNRSRWWKPRRLKIVVLSATILSLLAGNALAASTPAQSGPTLTVNPTSGPPGGSATVSGTSFRKNTPVVLTWDGSNAGMPTTTTRGNGSFVVNITIPQSTAGSHTIRATAGNLSASTTFTVGTATPTPAPTPMSTPTPTAGSSLLFGTLLTDPSKATQEYAANVRVVELEIGWDLYEPQDGVFNTNYSNQVKQKLQAFQAAGMKVVLGVGLQYPPSWVFNYPNSRYVNQFGTHSGELNLTFNQTLRQRAERYIARVAQDLGPSNFWAIRIGSGGLIEALYPDEWDGVNWHSYWAYDAAAQTGAGLPATVPVSPYPGWKPGQTQYNGRSFSTSQVQQWYDWYLGAMVDGINWQIATYKRLGFTGYLQVLMPGIGSRPSEHSPAINNHLNGAGDGNGTMGRAAVWHQVLGALNDRQNVVAYISSMADGSGNNDLCQPTDATVSLTDPIVETWSATRWISYLANRYGMPRMGENPGRSPTNGYGKTMMETAAQQMKACGFQGLMWAHDSNLYDGTSGVTLNDYAATIAQYS